MLVAWPGVKTMKKSVQRENIFGWQKLQQQDARVREVFRILPDGSFINITECLRSWQRARGKTMNKVSFVRPFITLLRSMLPNHPAHCNPYFL